MTTTTGRVLVPEIALRTPQPQRPWFTIEHTITAGDTSAVGPVYYARLIDWQGQCRERCGQLGAPIFSSDISGDYAMLTQSCSCEYLGELYFGDLVAIRLTVLWARMHLMKAEFHYHKINTPGQDGGHLVARGEQMWASARRNADGHYEPCPWPRELADCAATFGADISRAQIEDTGLQHAGSQR
ncbi:acyl-CoA thioesterase [Nocardia sp. NBC_00565]|uniref:acyl-CoA thioesterase n=1 Tax=Nocardia sp. NBC_00565 TaxID=2975993 RepID=UPI002E810302|nr:acyl-CoA thioesterase [Nocardia sp. NBC_00565]WUC06150.1 acyl-CoA thioesterase [Nocardia sp. NBC_00565]